MPGIMTTRNVRFGRWHAESYPGEGDGRRLFALRLEVNAEDAVHVCGLSAADVRELIHELQEALLKAPAPPRVEPRDCAGFGDGEAARDGIAPPGIG